jgi:hypothetical protein
VPTAAQAAGFLAKAMEQPSTEKADRDEPALVDGLVQGEAGIGRALAQLIRAARREVRLFAPVLNPAIFHGATVTQAMAHFVTQHSHNRIRILIEDVTQTLRDNGRLVDLARRLADGIELREAEDADRGARDLYLLADRSAFLMQEDVGRSDAIVNLRTPHAAAQLLGRFDAAWDRAAAVALRTLGL